jgi:hypothetical protein
MDSVIDKEMTRKVYKFEEGDPVFDMFYDGLVLLANGNANGALKTFETIFSTHVKNYSPVYRYMVLAMLECGRKLEDIQQVIQEWYDRAVTSGDKKEIQYAQFAKDLMTSIMENPNAAKRIIKDMVSGGKRGREH